MLIKGPFIISFLIIATALHSQDSLLHEVVDTIEYQEHSIPKFNKKYIVKKNSSIANVLHQDVFFAQNAGPGLLTTPLIHGMGARHTAILWDGFNIQSVINGTFDYNLVNTFKNHQIVTRSLSSSFGNAALSGGVLLSESKSNDFFLGINSMNNLNINTTHILKTKYLHASLNLNLMHNENQYNYDEFGTNKTQENAAFTGVDFRIKLRRIFAGKHILTLNSWVQDYSRSIPNSKTSINNQAKQDDHNARINLKYAFHNFSLSTAFFREDLMYQDISIQSDARVDVGVLGLKGEIEGFRFGLKYRRDKAIATFYQSEFTRHSKSFRISKSKEVGKRLKVDGGIFFQQIDDNYSPILYNGTIAYIPKENITLTLGVDKTFNLPTFNDLYWPNGGNENLLPERGLNTNFLIEYNYKRFRLTLDAYRKKVENWILWLPRNNIWSPKNQQSVLSMGIDVKQSYSFHIGSCDLSIESSFFLNSTSVKEDERPEIVGNDLIYTPFLRFRNHMNLIKNRWMVEIGSTSIGKRYTTFDNLEYVEGFSLFDSGVTYRFTEKMSVTFHIFNLFNKNYEQVRFFPTPLRNYNLKFHKRY